VIPPNVNEDFATSGPASTGATIIETVMAQAPLGQIWSFLGWSIVLTPYVIYDPAEGPGPTINGQLGKIVGGLTFSPATRTIENAVGIPGRDQPYVFPMLPMPMNTFGMTTLWDGRTDTVPPDGGGELMLPSIVPLPPTYANAHGLTPIIANYSLPVPAQIYPGEQMQFGLWITPSLAENFALAITQAAYVVVVDDGQPQLTTWGRDAATELAH
jgi:hypothetical protein